MTVMESPVRTPQRPAETTTRVSRRWQQQLLLFLMVAGPGLIVMEADNDAGAVSTYMQAGAQYGNHLLWILLLLLPITYFTQEMVARLGIATGQGHAAMIYQRFGKWWGRFSLIDLLFVNFLTLVTEFAAISLASSWAYGEVMGWPHSLHKKVWEAPGFYAAYILTIAPRPASCSSRACRCNW